MNESIQSRIKVPEAAPQRRAYIAGTGSYVPERVLTNEDLSKMVDTSDEWIVGRTGIRERRIAAADQYTSNMAAEAAKRALESAGVTPDQVQLVIVATITPAACTLL